MVADLSSDGLLILLWLLCRVKPNVQICSLRDLTRNKEVNICEFESLI